MATLRISKPAAGQTSTIQAEAGQTLQLNFPTDQAFPERVGNDLVFRFQDGSATRLTGFFTEFTRETLPDFVLNDQTELSGEDFFTAINPDLLPASGGSSGGSGEYRDDAGNLVDRLSALDPLNPVFWARDSEVPEESRGILANLTITPSEDPGLIIVPSSVNESDGMFYLILNLDRPVQGEVTVVLHVGGNADVLQNIGLGNEFRADVSLPNGVNYSYDPATGNLTITIPAGVTQVAVPVSLVDDHINDGAKQITFEIVDLAGPVTGGIGTVTTVDISEDNRFSHNHGGDERAVLDGPIVGVTVAEGSPETLYEGQPQGEAGNHFTFQITLKDPHNGGDYDGYKGDGLMSQDMTITLNVGGDARGGDASQAGGADFHLMPSAELQGLIASGAVSVALNPDGSIVLNSDGTFNITLNGRVDTDGSGGAVFNLKTDLGKLTVDAVPHINGDRGAAGEGPESITIGVGKVTGNEGQPAGGAPVLVGTIADDPTLNIDIRQDSVNESAGGFTLALDFDKELDPGTEVRIVLQPGGTATLGLAGAADSYKTDYFLPEVNGALGQSITMNADGTFTLTLHGSDFVLNTLTGKYEISLNVPVNDDHITEGGEETVTLAVNSITLTDANGVYTGSVGGRGGNDGTVITEDTEYNNRDTTSGLLEKDGPIISVTVDGNNSNVHGTETDLKAAGEHFFQINLTDPRTGADYAGFTGDAAGVLSQDINLVLNIGGEALRGADYTLDLDFLNALKDAGMLTFSGPDDDGNISITLFGLTGSANADGTLNPSAGNTPFDLGQLANLKIGVNIIDDTDTERAAENITVTISSPDGDNIGNESQIGAGASLTIDTDKESQFNGPVLNLVSDARVNESASDDPTYRTADNTAHHSITLDKAGTEDIKVLITLTGKDGAVLFNGSNGDSADFSWADKLVAIDANGEIMKDSLGNPLAVSCVDNGDGTYTITIPEGALRVDFDITITDDLRETTEGTEKYEVKLELVKTGGLADGEARLAGGASSIAKDTVIDPDLRDAAGNGTPLNPTNFDGPWVHLAADKTAAYESDTNGQATTIGYTVSLTDPAGGDDPYRAIEDVTVTLTLKGISPTFHLEYQGNFKYGDLTLDVRGYDPATKTGTLFDSTGKEVGKFVYDASTNSATIEVTIEAGQTGAQFNLKVNDDPLQGPNHDVADEKFSLQISGVKGNEARVDDADLAAKEATIKDDKVGTDTLEGIKVGLGWEDPSKLTKLGNIEEGNDYNLKLFLYGTDGKALAAGNNPYASYTGNIMPDDLSITMTLNPTGENANGRNQDVTFTLSAVLKTLITNGEVSITIGGTTYAGAIGAASLETLANSGGLHGQITVTLIGGHFDISHANNLTFVTNVHGDNVNEWDEKVTYLDSDKAAEKVSASLDSVNGNESAKAGNTSVETNITDRADGKITLSGGSFDQAKDVWNFKLAVAYKDGERLNNPTSTTVQNLPGETVHLQVKFTDSASMQHGQEYNVSAYSLFLSLNAGKAGIPTEAVYYQYIAGKDAAALMNPESGAPGWAKNLIMVADHNADAAGHDTWSGTQGDNTYDIYVPKGAWPANGQLNFSVDQGSHTGVAGTTFTVEVLDPAKNAADPGDMKGEIIDVSGKITPTLPGDKIVLGLEGGATIVEDTKMGGTDIDPYRVYFKDGNGALLPEGTSAAGDISFVLTFKPAAGVNFDFNLTDNYLDNWQADGSGKGDVAISGIGDYGSKAELITMLQAWLDGPGDQKGVHINDITVENGQVKFHITVDEGYDLSKGVKINFQALDDSVSDNSEKFTVQISGASSETNGQPDTLNLGIEKQRQGTTTILDEDPAYRSDNNYTPTDDYQPQRNGFAIALEPSAGNEANNVKGPENMVYVTTRAYILDDAGNTPKGLGALVDLYAKYIGDNSVKALLTAAAFQDGINTLEADFLKFVAKYYGPTQDITVTYKLGADGDTATLGKDYVDSNTHTFDSDGGKVTVSGDTINVGDWTLKVDAGGNVYFEAAGKDGLPVETIRDLANEGDETFTIDLVNVGGNESRPYENGKDGDRSDTATVTIKDVHDGASILKIGPAGGLVMEPVDTAHAPQPDGQHEANPKDVAYAITLDQATFEDMIVWIDPSASSATHGADFLFGKGVYYSDGANHYDLANGYTLNPDGSIDTNSLTALTPAQFLALFTYTDKNGNVVIPPYFADQKGFFVIIGEDHTDAKFTIRILDDNDDKRFNDGSADFGKEEINLSVTDVQGSEACAKGPGGLVPWDETVDYKYEFGGHQGVVDPTAFGGKGSFTAADGTVYEFGKAGNPAWLPSERPTAGGVSDTDTSSVSIADDMHGPAVTLSVGSPSWSDVGNINFTANIQDYASEPVTVTIKLIDGDTAKPLGFITVTIPAGELSANGNVQDLINKYNADPANTSKISLPEGNFYMQIVGSEGGESVKDGTPTFMDYDGGTGGPSIGLDNFGSFNGDAIHESTAGAPDYPTYTFNLNGITSQTVTDVEFDIHFLQGSAVNADMNGAPLDNPDFKVSVHLDAEDLKLLIAGGGKGAFVIEADANGNPVVYWNNGGTLVPLPHSTVSGKLPWAKLDGEVEGNENFHAIITHPSGVDINDGVATTTIIDETYVTVMLFDKNGNLLDNMKAAEGSQIEVTAKLVVCDAEGKPIDANGNRIAITADSKITDFQAGHAKEPLEFNINYHNGTAEDGKDFGGDQAFYFKAGESNTTFTLDIYDDMLSEGKETFSIDVTLTDGSRAAYQGDLTDKTDGVSDHYVDTKHGANIEIIDDLDGPWIKWSSAGSVKEGGSLTVNFGSYMREADSVRQVVEEKVELTFVLGPKEGSPLNIGQDIASITLKGADGNDVTFTINPDGSVSPNVPTNGVNLVSNGDGTYTITALLPEGSAMGTITITPRQDAITELDDAFNLRLTKVDGSETSIHSDSAGAKDVQVLDDNSGYKAVVSPVDGVEGDYAGLKIAFSGNASQAPGEDVKVVLTLDDNAKAMLDESGSIKITLPDGSTVTYSLTDSSGNPSWVSYDEASGKLTLTVPQATMAAAGNLTVLFPVEDNSIKGTDENFQITVGIKGGEIDFAGAPSFTSSFQGEEAANGGNQGGVTEFLVEQSGGNLNSVVGSMTITVSGAPAGVVSEIVIDGRHYNAGAWEVDGNGNLVIKGLPIETDYNVQVIYKQGVDSTAAKANVNVTGSLVSETGASIRVTDEPNAADHDGPVASLAFASATVEEGSAVVGVLHVQFPNLPGDADSNGDFHTAEKLTLTLQLSKNPDGTYSPVALDSGSPCTISGPNASGVVTITIPKGLEIPANGDLGINLNITLPDNSLAVNPDLSVTLTGIAGTTGAGQHYETMGIDQNAKSVSLEVTDNATDSGPTFTVTAGADVTEGGTATFTISSNEAMWKQVPNGTAVTATIQLTGLAEGDVVKVGSTVYTVDANGQITVPLTHANGSSSASVTVSVITADLTQGEGRGISAAVVGVSTFEKLGGSNSGTVDVATNDGLELGLSVAPHASDPAQLTYTIMLSALGGYAPVAGLTEELSFHLSLDGMSDAQKSSVAGQLSGAGYTGIVEGDGVTVTLAAGYHLENDALSFNVTPHTNYSSADTNIVDAYNVTLTPVDNAGGELNLNVDLNAAFTHTAHDLTITGTAGSDVIHGGEGNDVIHGGEGNDTIHGGAGNDVIHADSGDNLIYGGLGEDTMHAGTGHDTFAWASGDYDNGTDTVVGFTLDQDLLRFEDIFGGDPAAAVTMDEISNALADRTLGVTANDESTLTITVAHEGITQTVQVEMSANSHLSSDQITAINSGDAEAQATILHQMLTNLGG